MHILLIFLHSAHCHRQASSQHNSYIVKVHCEKKVIDFPVPSWEALTKLHRPGVIKLFPARESLVIDITSGDRKIASVSSNRKASFDP
jgi:hypothetical protein